MDNRIRPFLQRYTDFDFVIDYDRWLVRFSREVNGVTFDNIKVSRGKENLLSGASFSPSLSFPWMARRHISG